MQGVQEHLHDIRNSFKDTKLEVLDLRENNIKDYVELAKLIEVTHSLKELNISKNEIDDMEIENLWVSLHKNTTVCVFHFDIDEELHD